MVNRALVDAVARQEEALVLDAWTEESAWAIGSLLRGWASESGWPVAIDIRLPNRPLFFAAMPGSSPNHVDWARRKHNVVERFHKSSYRVGRELALKGETLAGRYGLPLAEYAEHGGGFPVRLKGAGVIGSIAVSGLAQEEDHMVIVRALCVLTGRDPGSLPLPS